MFRSKSFRNTGVWSWNGTWKLLIALFGESRWVNLPFMYKTWGFLLTEFTINPIKEWCRSTFGFDNHQIQSMHECDGTNLSFTMERAPLLSSTASFHRLLKDENFTFVLWMLWMFSKCVDEFHVWFNWSLIYPRTSSKLLNVFEVYHWTNQLFKSFYIPVVWSVGKAIHNETKTNHFKVVEIIKITKLCNLKNAVWNFSLAPETLNSNFSAIFSLMGRYHARHSEYKWSFIIKYLKAL